MMYHIIQAALAAIALGGALTLTVAHAPKLTPAGWLVALFFDGLLGALLALAVKEIKEELTK